ncbi:hypothetical protein ACH4E7_39795 [Kitasatospora sp. NPDC018058]|uniref:hypothetical protein n=1 Tax=Kitasatospora sp. NPDC018058 TaxID=3364025 RepID=UPI0037C113B3
MVGGHGLPFVSSAALAAAAATVLLDGPPPGARTAARLLGTERVATLPATTIQLGR